MRIELGCAAGDVERRDPPALKKTEDDVGDFAAHLLGAVRTRADMAMHAGLVAAVADIDLQGVKPAAADRREGNFLQQRKGLVHAGNVPEATGAVISGRCNSP